jgi:hypothetical protein
MRFGLTAKKVFPPHAEDGLKKALLAPRAKGFFVEVGVSRHG